MLIFWSESRAFRFFWGYSQVSTMNIYDEYILYIKLPSISSLKRIGRLNFLMKILATRGQLCTERLSESRNPPVKSQKFDHFWSLVTFRCIIDPIFSLESWPFRLFWGIKCLLIHRKKNFFQLYSKLAELYFKLIKNVC